MGKVVLISLGMSNTTQEFSVFKKLADADPNKSPHLVIVDCAQGGQAAHEWAHPDPNRSPWMVMDRRLEQADVWPAQGNQRWKGPGHNSIFQDKGQDYLVYHAYDAQNDGRSALRIRPLYWSSDLWPEVGTVITAPVQ
jgi:hypothetical protein